MQQIQEHIEKLLGCNLDDCGPEGLTAVLVASLHRKFDFLNNCLVPGDDDFVRDVAVFHEKFGLEYKSEPLHPEEWELRHRRLKDEHTEYEEAIAAGDDEEALDALVDLVYIAIGTAYRRGWDFAEAWRRVQHANMTKERGEPSNSKYGSGFDIVKPEGWVGPDHSDLVADTPKPLTEQDLEQDEADNS